MKTPPWLLAAVGSLDVGRTVVLDRDEARHLTGALRRRQGDDLVLADGRGSVARARLVTIARGRIEAEVLSVHREAEPQGEGVTVALALVDAKAMDWAVQKAVETGVRRLVPMQSERAQVRARDLAGRVEHWRRISMQALKQCRRPWAMEVADVVAIKALVEQQTKAAVVADREGCAIGELPDEIGGLLIVGPEGGFSADECELFDRRAWPRLRLGPHVLRSETAAVVGGAMMVARFENR